MNQRILAVGVTAALFSIALICGDRLSSSSLVWAQVDPVKVLVGTWIGHAELPRDSERVLIINSVTAKEGGGWVADGRFGFSVQKAPARQIDVSLQGNDVILEFVAGQNNPVRLKLVGENRLEGTVNVVLQNRTSNRSLKLEKKQ